MSKVRIRIWDRDFELNIAYQNYPGEVISDQQKAAFISVQSADYEPAIAGIEQYIRKHYSFELGEDNLDNIFHYVMPKSILIMRTKGVSAFALMCNFRFDMEHGIAVIFENGAYKDVGPQDMVL